MYPINERFLQVIEHLNITAYKLSKELETSEAVLSNIKKNKNKPSIEIIEKLLNIYKVISPEWLLTGSGSMISTKTNNSILEEPQPKYYTCQRCQDKDELITSLKQQIKTQAEYIEHLKEYKPADLEQKGKES